MAGSCANGGWSKEGGERGRSIEDSTESGTSAACRYPLLAERRNAANQRLNSVPGAAVTAPAHTAYRSGVILTHNRRKCDDSPAIEI